MKFIVLLLLSQLHREPPQPNCMVVRTMQATVPDGCKLADEDDDQSCTACSAVNQSQRTAGP